MDYSMLKRKKEQMIKEKESKMERKDKKTKNILTDSLINLTNEMHKLKAKVNELNSKINILESQRQKDQIIIAVLSDFVFQTKFRKIKKKYCSSFHRLFFEAFIF